VTRADHHHGLVAQVRVGERELRAVHDAACELRAPFTK
jgi:hypothetical protein